MKPGGSRRSATILKHVHQKFAKTLRNLLTQQETRFHYECQIDTIYAILIRTIYVDQKNHKPETLN